MLLSKTAISPYSLKKRDGSFSLASALHEWNYQNATDVGTTITAIDTGSIGGLDMTNPDAASEPTLNSNGWSFDGVNDALKNSVTDFRSGDSTGVVHILFDYTSDGNNKFLFTLGNTSTDVDFFIFGVNGTGDLPQVTLLSGTSTSVIISADSISDGWNVLSFVGTGSDFEIYINGVISSSYSVDTIGNRWMNYRSGNGSGYNNIDMASIQRLTPIYYLVNNKYVAYCPYVNGTKVISEANQILNSGL